MFLKALNRTISWTATYLSVLTMIISPVAMGRESDQLTQKKLQMYLQEFGLDKRTTLGEYWEKSKVYYPGFIYKDLEKFVQENKNMLMPEVKLSTAKGTDGNEVPVLTISGSGKSNTIQFFGDKNKWAKFNNVVLSENDLRSVEDVFKRVEASDIRIKREADRIRGTTEIKNSKSNAMNTKQQEKVLKDFARFKGFPRLSPMQWKAMTPAKRAGYIVNMRLLWKDARQVLLSDEVVRENHTNKSKKYSSFEEFYKVIFGDEAIAADKKTATKEPAKLSTQGLSVVSSGEASAPVAPLSKKCIVAGFVSEEGKGTNYGGERNTCSEEMVFKSEKYNRDTPEMKMVRDAKFECQQTPTTTVCNPLIYGYKSDGAAICVDRMKTTPGAPAKGNFQKATWWDGPCDSASKLTETQIKDNMKESDKQYSDQDKRYDENGKIKSEAAQAQINLIEDDQFKNDSFKRTKDYLNGVLENKKKNAKADYSIDDLIQGKKAWTKEIDEMLIEIQSQFEVEIGEAIQSCEISITRKDNVDKNQKGACDQLHRRWLFTERFISEFRSKSCLGDSTYIWKLDQSKMSKDQVDTAKQNKEKIKSDAELCQCKSDPNKKIKFNDDKGCLVVPPVAVDPLKCPEGLVGIENGKKELLCACPGSTENIPLKDANDRIARDGFDKMCPKATDENKCDVPKGIINYDYTNCDCSKGKLTDENEAGFLSKIFHANAEKKEPKWVCKEKSFLPWILGGLALLIGIGIFNRDKKPTPPDVPVCKVTCTGNSTLNEKACRCDVNPPAESCAAKFGTPPNCSVCPTTNTCVLGQQIYNQSTCQCDDKPQPITCENEKPAPNNNRALCDKCPDGSYKTTAKTGRPNGCPQISEGGNGKAPCEATKTCSGGVPVGH